MKGKDVTLAGAEVRIKGRVSVGKGQERGRTGGTERAKW